MSWKTFQVLTTGLRRGIEGLCYLRIHLDGKALLDHELFVPLLYLKGNPFCERVTKNGSTNVPNPGLWHFLDLFAVGQVGLDVGVFGNEVCYVVQC